MAVVYDILAALGKPVPLTGYTASDPRPAWTLCAAWSLALPVTCLTVLRAHLLKFPQGRVVSVFAGHARELLWVELPCSGRCGLS
jgi:hypothetical protein